MTDDGFDASRWLAANPANGCDSVHVAQPQQLGIGWTKASAGAGGGVCHGDGSGLLPFALPRLPASLDDCSYVGKSAEGDVGVETVCRAAAAAGARLADCDVLSFRNNLNKIFGTPFDRSAAWTVDACLLEAPAAAAAAAVSATAGSSTSPAAASSPAAGAAAGATTSASAASSSSSSGTLFLDIVKMQEQWSGNPADQERFTAWGYRFEALCTGQDVADASSEFGVLLRTRIDCHRLFIGAEIDCFDPLKAAAPPADARQGGAAAPEGAAAAAGAAGAAAGAEAVDAPTEQQQQQEQQAGPRPPPPPPGLQSYLELKTYRLPQHSGQQRSRYRFKHPKWWLQSFLAGVPRLALGARDDQGVVHRIDLVATADLPRISAQAGVAFSPNQALLFGAAVLAWMRQRGAARPGQHLRFSYSGSAPGGGSSGSGGGVIRCQVLEGGALPQRIQRCLKECGLLP